jgi:hypothetical protein
MDVATRDKLIFDALAACSVDLDSAVSLVAPHPSRLSVETLRVSWGSPPRFVVDGPGQPDGSV